MTFVEIFKTLNAIDVSDHIEKKPGSDELSYLSWSWAFQEVSKRYNWDYKVITTEDGSLFTNVPGIGAYVSTEVTIEGVTRGMMLPIMDGSNKAMRDEPYEYQTKYGKKRVEAFNMMDINKTIMRCLVKNLARFGLGLYIYSGEDLPEGVEEEKPTKAPTKKEAAPKVPTPKVPTQKAPTPKVPVPPKAEVKAEAKEESKEEVKAPVPHVPTPKAPVPHKSEEEVPTPVPTPTPKAPVPHVPTPKAPTPKAPVPHVPTPKAPMPKAPVPHAPVPKAPTPRVPKAPVNEEDPF